jgi:hypothetical protein
MARNWNARSAPKPTSITEVARRYHAAAVALAQTLGLSLPEVLTQHRESVTAVFIECGRCDLRLPAGVRLPPVVPPTPGRGDDPPDAAGDFRKSALQKSSPGDEMDEISSYAPGAVEPADVTSENNYPRSIPDEGQDGPARPASMAERPNGHTPLPTALPSDGDLPCAGQEIATLKPAALAMLIGKVARLAHAEGAGWAPLLHALESERSTRLAQGRRPLAVVSTWADEVHQD